MVYHLTATREEICSKSLAQIIYCIPQRLKKEEKAAAQLQEQNRKLATEKERLAAEKEQQQLMKEREVAELRHQLQTSQLQRATAQKERKGFFGEENVSIIMYMIFSRPESVVI